MKNFNMHVPKRILDIIEIFEKHNYEIYLVGGCVRDAIVDLEVNDYDLCTNATVEEMTLLAKRYDIPTINNNGLDHGTVTFRYSDDNIEVTTYRKDVECDGRHAKVDFNATLEDDLARRDLTINAIAYNPKVGLVDPFYGYNDLEYYDSNGFRTVKIRTVGKAEERFKEDWLRMLRAIRFGAKFEYCDFDYEVVNSILEYGHKIPTISKERITDELRKMFNTDNRRGINIFTSNSAFYNMLFKNILEIDINQDIPYDIRKISDYFSIKKMSLTRFIALIVYVSVYHNMLPIERTLHEEAKILGEKIIKSLVLSNEEGRDIRKYITIMDMIKQEMSNEEMKRVYDVIGEVVYGCQFIDFVQSIRLYNQPKIETPYQLYLRYSSNKTIFKKDICIDGNYVMRHTNIRGVDLGKFFDDCHESLLKNEISNDEISLTKYMYDWEKEYL